MTIADRLAETHDRIAAAARAAGRDPATVRLLAVSKRHPASAIREAHAAGQRDFGENYVQELAQKAAELHDLADLRFHLIGHLQTNKAKLVAGLGASVQTVDSARLAESLAKHVAPGTKLGVHLQVNVAGEDQKSGCEVGELPALVAAVRALPSLRLEGLMTVPPEGDPARTRAAFRELARLAREHALDSLSIGMSSDLEIAIDEGATIVRVGTAIFGARS